ncbi:hypothetical protein J3Q64DRAFT_1724677 [Phycomyces blakesleeanus]|uniref:Uncharacterized protein n=1 Tax=Phycomyces blakesleeanus TaxID=4837 RepID=A0ABR3B6E9_PHYBL
MTLYISLCVLLHHYSLLPSSVLAPVHKYLLLSFNLVVSASLIIHCFLHIPSCVLISLHITPMF